MSRSSAARRFLRPVPLGTFAMGFVETEVDAVAAALVAARDKQKEDEVDAAA